MCDSPCPAVTPLPSPVTPKDPTNSSGIAAYIKNSFKLKASIRVG